MGWALRLAVCLVAHLAGAGATVAIGQEVEPQFCDMLRRVADDARVEQPRHVKLSTDGVGAVVGYKKTCEWSDQEQPSEVTLCEWWVNHSANEFFYGNASEVADCLGVGSWFDYYVADNQRLFGVTLFIEAPPEFDQDIGVWLEYSLIGSAAGIDDAGAFIDIKIKRLD